ncbi:MAG TPA: uroporphyrinogen-III synthase [Blastocatellia bacterium]|nr:uroporphyrinogen-III synthase [Blastocatellia bacterium]
MTDSMGGARIALLEARMSRELANLVQNYGGEAVCVPAVKEAPLECAAEVSAFIDRLSRGGYQAVVFLTGVGARALFKEAEALGRAEELSANLRKVTTICRGPKPSSALKQFAIPISISAPEPFTSKELLEAAKAVDLQARSVCLLHYGQRNAELTAALQARGAQVDELCLYEWQMPEDTGPLATLIGDIIGGNMDSVAFTSQVQIMHLFQVASGLEKKDELERSLNTKTAVASIGPTTTACLLSFGVTPKIEPEHPRMGYLVSALAAYFSEHHPGTVVESN